MNPHVVAVPFPAPGHAIPLLEFAKEITSHGVTVSCATTPANVLRLQHQMSHAISSGLVIRMLVFPTPAIEGLPEGVENFDQVPKELCGHIYQLVQKLEEAFNSWINECTGPLPACIIYDALLGWSMEAAQKHKIPAVAFSTYGAFGLSALHSVWLSASRSHREDSVASLDLPGPDLKLGSHEIGDAGLLEPFMMDVLGRLQSVNHGCGLLVNTFQELEPEYVQQMRKVTGKPVWCIGPVLPQSFCCGRGKTADVGVEELVHWLDSRKSSSVVYISFGSQTFLSAEQCKALASGVEASEQAFIWAIKVSPRLEPATSPDPDLAATYLPRGFRERTRNRGMLIWGWAPQLVILSHPSVGGFMSHCGWNSMVESVSLGVPLMTWPMYADQHFNSRLAAELGIGVQVCQHMDAIPDTERVKDGVTRVVCGDEGKKMRICAQKLKEMVEKAVGEGGSSHANLQDFVRHIFKLDGERKVV